MKRTLEALNQMVRDGIIEAYAIGGAMAALFHVETILTYDLDVFTFLPSKGPLVSLTPLYDYLRGQGYTEEGECVSIAGVPVQFLPAHDALLKEAVNEAATHDVEGTAVRVFTPEHQAAVCVATGREKDRVRINLLLDAGCLDLPRFDAIINRHGLEGKWNRWKR